MSIISALVLLAITWFMVLFVMLPIGLRTQGDEGEVVPGTHAGAPANLRLKRKLAWVTAISFAIWVVLCAIILSGVVTLSDFDLYRILGPGASGGGTGG